MRVFCLWVYSFVICESHSIVFGAHFFILLSLERLWASFWEPLGRLGLPRGSPCRHFGPPLAPLRLRGAIWGTLGSQGELGMTWGPKDVQFRANGSQVARLRTKSDLAGISAFSAGSALCALSPKSGARAASPDPTSRAGG